MQRIRIVLCGVMMMILLSACGSSSGSISNSAPTIPMAVSATDSGQPVSDSELEIDNDVSASDSDLAEDNKEIYTDTMGKQPYYELSISPENFKIAGYTCVDGNHLADIQRIMEETIPDTLSSVGYGGNENYQGWYYAVDDFNNRVYIFYWNSMNDELAMIDYSLGNDINREVYGDSDELGFTCYVDWNTLPEVPFVENSMPLGTTYEETLDLLNLKELVGKTEESGEENRRLLTFTSQYGADCTCYCRPDIRDNSKAIEITTPEWSVQLGFENDRFWRFFFWKTRNPI